MLKGSSEERAESTRLVALRQAAVAAAGGRLAPIPIETMASALTAPAKDSEVDRYMERLLKGDQGSILQDLVMAGVCSFTNLAAAIRIWAPEEAPLLAWADGMARMEAKEATVLASIR